MNGQPAFISHLRFYCPHCRAELAVPAQLAGVKGPCPSCFQPIEAPFPEAMCGDASATFLAGGAPHQNFNAPPPGNPAQAWMNSKPALVQPRSAATASSQFENSAPGRGFRAHLAIPPPEEPLDDTWKDKHRDQSRQTRRVRRAEKAAQSLLESKGFQLARAGMILASAGMVVWLFLYMKDHQWTLPGMSAPVAAETPAGGTGSKPRPVASGTFTGDNLEFPAAADEKPAVTSPLAPAVAGSTGR
jgi:hypothetical protein